LRFLLQPINYRFTLHLWWLAGLPIGHKKHDFRFNYSIDDYSALVPS
jgi:hypothetical protein